MGRKHGLSVKIQLDLFDKMVKPILLYGCEVWGFSNNDIIEKVHLKICKLLLHLGTDHWTWRGGYGFLFRSEFFFRTTQELEYLFFLSRKARNFFPEFNIMLYKGNNKITEQSYKGKVKTHNYINRQNQSTTGKLWKP